MLQDRADKICEMANVMQKSIQIDEENMAKEQELMARLATENKVGPTKKPMHCMFTEWRNTINFFLKKSI